MNKHGYHYRKKVSLLGGIGTFSEMAALEYFDTDIDILSCKSFEQITEMVRLKKADYAILPIENSQTGSIDNVHDILLEEDLFAVGEVVSKIEHCLIAHHGTETKQIKKIYSHPQALAQCEKYLLKNFSHCQIIPVYNTAGSVKQVKEEKDFHAAGIASKRAADFYEMQIIDRGIEDNPFNYTRFLIFSPQITHSDYNNKTSIIFAVANVPGAICRCLEEFSVREINLTRLGSRPSKRKPWEYIFFMDFEKGLHEKVTEKILANIRKHAILFKVIGTYKAYIGLSYTTFQ